MVKWDIKKKIAYKTLLLYVKKVSKFIIKILMKKIIKKQLLKLIFLEALKVCTKPFHPPKALILRNDWSVDGDGVTYECPQGWVFFPNKTNTVTIYCQEVDSKSNHYNWSLDISNLKCIS